MIATGDVPTYDTMFWPTLDTVSRLGGSGSISEINAGAIERQRYTEAVQAVLHGEGPRTQIEYRLAWARSHLKAIGMLTNSARGIWSLTDAGQALIAEGEAAGTARIRALWREASRERNRRRRQPVAAAGVAQLEADERDTEEEPFEESEDAAWQSKLLSALMDMDPPAFERLTQRLLREADFVSVKVTGKSGDGGIDGVGVYRISLLTFPVFFQCKRYRGSVGSGAVRDFRGAMTGRGDKGLLITTGTFTAEAKTEASRDGAPPVDLIDGLALCDLLKRYDLGVHTVIRQVEDVAIDREFFEQV